MARDRRKTVMTKSARPDTRGRDDILNLVERLGVAAEYRQIPDGAKSKMYAACLPPLVTLDHTVQRDADAELAAEGIREGLRQVELIHCGRNDASVPLISVYTGLPHLESFLRRFCAANPTHQAAQRCRAAVDDACKSAVPAAGGALENIVLSRLMPFQRFDRFIYGLRFARIAPGSRQIRLNLQLFRESARRAQIEFQGIARPAYQCAGFLRPGIIDWVAWKPADVQLQGPDTAFPVYVQSHALRNFYERLGVPEKMNQPTVMMFQSLLKPNIIVRNDDGSMLIEFRGEHGRLGYFVTRFLGDSFLVNTFLFLTMSGTPEAALLYEKLKVTRHAVEMMKLDDLATFMLSDIRHDKKIAGILEECGCGHLLTITDRLPFKLNFLMRHANHLRRILGWSPNQSQAAEPSVDEVLTMMNQLEDVVAKAEQTPGFFGRVFKRLKGTLDEEQGRRLPPGGKAP